MEEETNDFEEETMDDSGEESDEEDEAFYIFSDILKSGTAKEAASFALRMKDPARFRDEYETVTGNHGYELGLKYLKVFMKVCGNDQDPGLYTAWCLGHACSSNYEDIMDWAWDISKDKKDTALEALLFAIKEDKDAVEPLFRWIMKKQFVFSRKNIEDIISWCERRDVPIMPFLREYGLVEQAKPE